MHLAVFDGWAILLNDKTIFVNYLILTFHSIGEVLVAVIKTYVLILEVKQILVDLNILTTEFILVLDFGKLGFSHQGVDHQLFILARMVFILR